MHLTAIDLTYRQKLSVAGVEPCCPDCDDGHESLHFRQPTLMMSTQIDQCKTAPSPANGALALIQATAKGEMLVDGARGFLCHLNALAETAKTHRLRGKTLDLIDHSHQFHELNIGGRKHGVTISERWFQGKSHPPGEVRLKILDALKTLVGNGIIDSIRLLGCQTGDSKGLPNLRWLHTQLGIVVLGTNRMIDARDFTETGFCAEGALVACYSDNTSRPHQ